MCWKNLICFALLAVKVKWTRGIETYAFYAFWGSLKIPVEHHHQNSVNISTTTTLNDNRITHYFLQRYFLLLAEVLEKLYFFCIVGFESNMD